jgi:hypothetical protein
MQAGDLRSRVGFYKRGAIGADSPPAPDYGTTEGEYPDTPEFTCAANIKPRLGGESVLAARLTGTNLVNITVWRSSDTAQVDTSWRLKDERTGVLYNIRSVIDPDEHTAQHGRWLELLCERGVA